MSFKREWLSENSVLSYEVETLNSYDLVKWSNDVITSVQQWNPLGHYLVLYNLSSNRVSLPYLVLTGRDLFNVGLTDSGKLRIKSHLEKQNGKKLYLGLVLSSSASSQMLQKYQIEDEYKRLVIGKVFYNTTAALQWLTSQNHSWDAVKTRPISLQEMRRAAGMPSDDSATELKHGSRTVTMLINDAIEVVQFPTTGQIIIGRKSQSTSEAVDVDLSTYGFSASSVSRKHAQIYFQNDYLYIMDLNSTNGTYLSGTRLSPNTPYAIKKNDIVKLGDVTVNIVF